jgi:hypothetical protein
MKRLWNIQNGGTEPAAVFDFARKIIRGWPGCVYGSPCIVPGMAITPLDHIPAWRAGANGGAIASIGQFVGTTLNDTLTHLFEGEMFQVMTGFGAFIIGGVIMTAAGAVIGHFMQAKTSNRWTLFLAGAAFTSIGTTALPGINKFLKRADIAPISVAYAAEKAECRDVGASLYGGVKQFFGLDEAGYRVVVGSFKNKSDAIAFANKINAQDSSLRAVAGDYAPCNEFFPVYVGSSTNSLSEAKKTQAKVNELDFVPGSFISKRNY